MKEAYLLYERQDAEKNDTFINQMIDIAKHYHIELSLVIVDELDIKKWINGIRHPLFVWNRTRQAHIAKEIELAGMKVFNCSFVNGMANDKKSTLQFAQQLGIPTVPILLEGQIKDFPVIIKTVDGHGGNEVALCLNVEDLERYKDKWRQRKTLIQPYIESHSTDIRVWGVGSTIIGAVKRIGAKDFRSNYTLGGSIEKYDLSVEQSRQVLKLQNALKSDYIGFDFLLLPNGDWLLNEIEDPVGARSYYQLYSEALPNILIKYFIKNSEE